MRDNSLCINKYVQKILEESEEVVSILGGNKKKIFALKQNENITFPFIVHSRSNLTTTYTKDIEYIRNVGWTNTVQFTVCCVSDDYIQVIDLANAVRHSLETYRLKNDDIYIHPILLINAIEYMTDYDAYVQELQFQCIVE